MLCRMDLEEQSLSKEKGVSKSTLEQLFNKQTQEDQGAIVLAQLIYVCLKKN